MQNINKLSSALIREVAEAGAPFAKIIFRDAQDKPIAAVIICVSAYETEEVLEAVEDVEAGWEPFG
jgi:hypothetical protein